MLGGLFGGAKSKLYESLMQEINVSMRSKCATPSVCQTTEVKNVDFGSYNTITCDDADGGGLANNQSSLSFDCSANQAIDAFLKAVQSAKNSAESNFGSFAKADSEISVKNAINSAVRTSCGGSLKHLATAKNSLGSCTAQSAETSGAMNITAVMHDNLTNPSAFCDAANNSSNEVVTCMMSQVAKATAKTDQAATNIAKNDSVLSGLFNFGFGGIVVFLILAVVLSIVGSVAKGGAAALRRRREQRQERQRRSREDEFDDRNRRERHRSRSRSRHSHDRRSPDQGRGDRRS